jgi:hypothetical protein
MGGYGASRIGMKHSDVFGALYIMSPCCMSPMGGGGPGPGGPNERDGHRQREEGCGCQVSSRSGGEIAGLWRRAVCNGCGVGAQPKNPPLYFDLPTKDGVPVPEVQAKFIANAPLVFVHQYIGNLKQYRAIAMDVGDQDGLRIDAGQAARYIRQLRNCEQL